MGLFGKENPTASLQEDFLTLRRRVDQLESDSKIGKLEAAEIYDKTLRLMQRMAKRYAVDQKELELEIPPDAPEETAPTVDEVTQRILNRRARGLIQ